MRILMIAPPGAGKGTQGALIAAHFNIPHIATGELLRDHVARQTALGQAVQAYLERGELVPDQIVLDMTREAIIAAKAAGGDDRFPGHVEHDLVGYQFTAFEIGLNRLAQGSLPRYVVAQQLTRGDVGDVEMRGDQGALSPL